MITHITQKTAIIQLLHEQMSVSGQCTIF